MTVANARRNWLTHKSGSSNHKEWIITFKPWLLPRIPGWMGYVYV